MVAPASPFRPSVAMPRATLRLVSAPPPSPVHQDCSVCRNISNCWAPGIEDRLIIISLLVCRMKRGIQVNASTKLFLEMIRPKLKRMAQDIHKDVWGYHDMDVIRHDLESAAVEQILRHYSIGEIAYPLHYLFGFPNGVLRRFASAYRERLRRNFRYRMGMGDDEQVEEPRHDERLDDEKVTLRMDTVRHIINNGVTLRAAEYRVMSFCLANAKDGGVKRPINGLHTYLAKSLGVIRPRVTKLWSDACAKIIEAETAL